MKKHEIMTILNSCPNLKKLGIKNNPEENLLFDDNVEPSLKANEISKLTKDSIHSFLEAYFSIEIKLLSY